MSDLEMKSFGPFEIKDESRGEVVAVVSSLDTVDHDREVVRASAIKGGSAKVKISFYGHDAAFGEAPVGKGVITAEGGKGILRGNFFMSTQRGREAFETVKALGADGEWSIGFRVLKDSQPDDTWKAQGAKRMIDEIELFEVSPVLRGASPNTGTLAIKAADDVTVAADAEAVVEVEPTVDTVEAKADDLVIETPADAVAAEAEARIAAEAAEAKATADVAAQLKAEALEEYERVQRALKRMGYAA